MASQIFQNDDGLALFNIEAEQEVLGGILLNPKAIDKVIGFLKPEHFHLSDHGIIYQAILGLENQGKPTTPFLVIDYLRESKLSETADISEKYIWNLVGQTVSTVAIDLKAKIVVEKWKKRRRIFLYNQLSSMESAILPLDKEAREEFATQKTHVKEQLEALDESDAATDRMVEVGSRVLDVYESLFNKSNFGILSGIHDLDRILGGFKPQDLILLCARPGTGKTWLGLHFLRECVKKKIPAVFFSAETSTDASIARLISMESRVDVVSAFHRNPSTGMMQLQPDREQQVLDATVAVGSWPLHIDDTPGSELRVSYVKNRCQALKKHHGQLGLIVVDYLQLLETGDKEVNRPTELAKLSRQYKSVAKALNTPVVMLAQIAAAVEGRNDKRPCNADLADSKSPERDADVILHLYRDKDKNARIQPDPHTDYFYEELEIILGKIRNGANNAPVKVSFVPAIGEVRNL